MDTTAKGLVYTVHRVAESERSFWEVDDATDADRRDGAVPSGGAGSTSVVNPMAVLATHNLFGSTTPEQLAAVRDAQAALIEACRFESVLDVLDDAVAKGGASRPAALRAVAEAAPPWFKWESGKGARPVTADDVWHPGCLSGRAHQAAWAKSVDEMRAAGFALVGVPTLDDEETLLRGLALPTRKGAVVSPTDDMHEIPEFRGVPGLLRWLAEGWPKLHAAGVDQPQALRNLMIPVEAAFAVRARCGIGGPAVLTTPKAPTAGMATADSPPLQQAPRKLPDGAASLHLVGTFEGQKAAQVAAIAALRPPPGFVIGGGWKDSRAELLRQYETLKAAGLSSEGALIELHKAWGYSKREDRNGGPLAKVLTKARAERAAKGQRRGSAG